MMQFNKVLESIYGKFSIEQRDVPLFIHGFPAVEAPEMPVGQVELKTEEQVSLAPVKPWFVDSQMLIDDELHPHIKEILAQR